MLVAAHPRVMVHIAGLGHADHGMDQQVGFRLSGGPESQLLVGTVHRVAGLECHDLAPAEFGKPLTEFGGRVPQMAEIVVDGRLDAAQSATHVHRVRLVHQVVDAGMSGVLGSEHAAGLGFPVGRIDILDRQGGDQHAFLVTKGDLLPGPDRVRKRLAHVQGDGNWPQGSARQTHGVHDRLVVRLAEKTGQRREGAVQQHLDVADLAGCQVPGLQVPGLLALRGRFFFRQIQIDQHAPVGLDHLVSALSGIHDRLHNNTAATRAGPERSGLVKQIPGIR